jgi:hypothetical protein
MMMRVGLLGIPQIAYNAQGVFTGCNLGYNYVEEHQNTLDLVRTLNADTSVNIDKVRDKNQLSAELKFKKLNKQDASALAKYKSTPYADYVLKPSVPIYYRPVTINNEGIRNKYLHYLLDDGDYFFFMVSTGFIIEAWKQKLDKRRIFTEDEFFYMNDYQPLTNGVLTINKSGFAGAWDKDGFEILIKRDIRGEQIVGLLESTIRCGNLAVVSEEKMVFKDKGCCLLLLDKAYTRLH